MIVGLINAEIPFSIVINNYYLFVNLISLAIR